MASSEVTEIHLKDYAAYPYDVENVRPRCHHPRTEDPRRRDVRWIVPRPFSNLIPPTGSDPSRPPRPVRQQVTLEFDLEEEFTVVTATSVMRAKPSSIGAPLVLDGRQSFMELLAIYIDDKPVPSRLCAFNPNAEDTRLVVDPAALPADGAKFTLGVVTKFKPQDNLELSGLYKSSGNFCTQCEAEGFRLITYYPDRPDVMSVFTTKIRADKTKYPVLLSNGNLVGSCDLAGGRHMAVWVDPWRKPCYLFALVAGDLAVVESAFTTCTGKTVDLRIYAEQKNISRCDFAMESLKRAMKWDEERFGLEYDLDLFNIVAVDDFNMGAMENKSLNLFNSRLVLATADSATDAAFARIEGVIGHEYFHNWTGNRVTCRDWFQLSLKEGLTVFRDQEFSSDMGSRSVKRIGDVRYLRDAQFAEDASPMAHPVRPASYMKIDNFYTLTVYEKGAEVIRMYHTLLGEEGFRKGTDLYFERHDGQAVTTDDFFQAMSDANPGCDIGKLKNWYSQAGTPTVTCERAYDAGAKTYSLTLTQVLPKTPDTGGDQPKVAQLIPVKVGLVDAKTGKDLDVSGNVSVTSAGSTSTCVPVPGDAGSVVLRLNDMSATFTFAGVESEPVPSVLRGFSAPVKLAVTPALTADELLFQLAHDSDPFNRWEAAQKMAREIMCRAIRSTWHEGKTELASDDAAAEAIVADVAWGKFVDACKGIFRDAASDVVDRAWVEEALSFPGVGSLVQELKPVDPLAVHKVVKQFSRRFALACSDEIEACYATCKAEAAASGEYLVDETQTARRSLMGYCMALMGAAGHGGEDASELAAAAKTARNMTETVAALGALNRHPTAKAARDAAFDAFKQKWRDDNNVICTYLSLVAGNSGYGASPLTEVKATMADESVYSHKIPNKFYSLIGGFARGNTPGFHAADGSGYVFLADCLLAMDKTNAIAASRLAKPFTEWRLYDAPRQALMKGEIDRILKAEPSPNMFEIMTKSLA